ncbi:MAG: isoprenylcysteine carboxylmethyltransferase family protein [Planctomycetaceae bacterium]
MLSQRMVNQGHHLFRFRSFLPLVFIVPLIFSMWDFHYLLNSHTAEQVWLWLCFAVSVLGFGIRITTVGFAPEGTSGRNTKSQVASRLNCTGWYSVCRNPLYLGNYIMALGIVLAAHDALVAVLYTTSFWIYYERIVAAEEEFLSDKFGDKYLEWAKTTPVFIPSFRNWTKPDLPFCLRTVFRREYPSVLLLGLTYLILNIAESWAAERTFHADASWCVVGLGSIAVFFVLRTLKKRTQLLNVAGR